MNGYELEQVMSSIVATSSLQVAPISKAIILHKMKTSMQWIKISNTIKNGLAKSGQAYKPSTYTAEHLLDQAGLDMVVWAGNTKVGIDITLDGASANTKAGKLASRAAAYAQLGIPATVVLSVSVCDYTPLQCNTYTMSSFAKYVVPSVLRAGEQGLRGHVVEWNTVYTPTRTPVAIEREYTSISFARK